MATMVVVVMMDHLTVMNHLYYSDVNVYVNGNENEYEHDYVFHY